MQHLSDGLTTLKNKATQTIYGFVLLIILTGIMALGLVKLWDLLSQAKPEVAAAIIAVTGSSVISLISLIVTRNWEKQKEIDQNIRVKKQEIYEDLIQFLFSLVMSRQLGTSMTQEEVIKSLFEFTHKLMIWGSDSVVKEFSNFRRHFIARAEKTKTTNTSDAEGFESLLMLEHLIYTIRADIGHKNKNLAKGDILSLFINDTDKYI